MSTIQVNKETNLIDAINLLPTTEITFVYPYRVTLTDVEWKFILDAAREKIQSAPTSMSTPQVLNANHSKK